MTRYADDLHLAVKAMSYKSKVDLRLDEPVDIKSLNVFYAEQFKDTIGLALPNKEMMSSVRRASKYLEECGARVRVRTLRRVILWHALPISETLYLSFFYFQPDLTFYIIL